jgi:hypothetical protein
MLNVIMLNSVMLRVKMSPGYGGLVGSDEHLFRYKNNYVSTKFMILTKYFIVFCFYHFQILKMKKLNKTRLLNGFNKNRMFKMTMDQYYKTFEMS